MKNVNQIAIIGTGLLGGSIGLALRAAGFAGRIVGVGRRQETLDTALRLGCIDEGTSDVSAAAAASQLLVLATPLGLFASLFEQLASGDHPELIITDVGSTKAQVCAEARRLLPDATRFVGAHPMAGSELHGPQYARADLFTGRLCVLTPEGTASDERALATVSAFWRLLGMRLTHKSPGEHDQLVSIVSHLPHAAAVVLVSMADRHKALSIASSGFSDTTRIASGDVTVWADVFRTNRSAMVHALDEMIADLGSFRQMLADGLDERLIKQLEQGKAARDRWLKEDGGLM